MNDIDDPKTTPTPPAEPKPVTLPVDPSLQTHTDYAEEEFTVSPTEEEPGS